MYIDFEKENKNDLKEFCNSLFNCWWKKLNNKTKSKIIFYKLFKSYASKINNDLRNDIKNNNADLISEAIKLSTINKDIILLRNTNNRFLEANNKNIYTIKKGDILLEKGLMSTSLIKKTWAFKGKILLRIKCPKGVNGAYLDKCCLSWGEKEILLDKNTKLQIDNVIHNKKQIIIETHILK